MAIAITVKFLSGTNTTPPRMRAYCRLAKPVTVNYPAVGNFDMSDIEACARYAAGVMLVQVNEECADHGAVWALDQYIESYDGNRHFSLK